jgi:hypothetical protein
MPLAIPDLLKPLLAKPVAVLGAGVSGRAVAGLLGSLGVRAELFDEKGGEGVAVDFVSAVQGHGLVVFSPGFAPGHPWLAAARAAGRRASANSILPRCSGPAASSRSREPTARPRWPSFSRTRCARSAAMRGPPAISAIPFPSSSSRATATGRTRSPCAK